MKINLLHATPLWLAPLAIRTCYDSNDKSDTRDGLLGAKDAALIKGIVKSGHTSTIEHINYAFMIEGISRGCLQELARHRHASLSVQSSRYTLKKLLMGLIDLDELLVPSGNKIADNLAQVQLRSVAFAADRHNIPNDQLKYALPEAYKTTLVWSINARSLRNFFILRMSERAHWEIRKLAFEVFGAIPNDHVILYEDVVMPHLEKVAERQLEVQNAAA